MATARAWDPGFCHFSDFLAERSSDGEEGGWEVAVCSICLIGCRRDRASFQRGL